MKSTEVLERYLQICIRNLEEDSRVLSLLKGKGIKESFLIDNFSLGFSNGALTELIEKDQDLIRMFEKSGILNNGKDVLKNRLIIPLFNENRSVVNIAGFSLHQNSKRKLVLLNPSGIFNQAFLKNSREIILTMNPVEALLLIQNDYPNVTFLAGDDPKYIHFIKEHNIRKAIFTFEGKTNLYYELTKNGISTKRLPLDFSKVLNGKAKQYLEQILSGSEDNTDGADTGINDTIRKIENGLLF